MRPSTTIYLAALLGMLSVSPGAPAEPEGARSREGRIRVEGVAASARAAPLAAVREAPGRLAGRRFTVAGGRHVNFPPTPVYPLDIENKEVLSVEKLPTGLYRAVITIPAEPRDTDREQLEELEELIVRGKARLGEGLLRARDKARREAEKEAVLTTVERLYPGRRPPTILKGRLYHMETLRERIEGGSYFVTVRVRVTMERL